MNAIEKAFEEHNRLIDGTISRLAAEQLALATQVSKLQAILEECVTYFDDRADVVDGDEGPLPNTEMTLLSECKRALGR